MPNGWLLLQQWGLPFPRSWPGWKAVTVLWGKIFYEALQLADNYKGIAAPRLTSIEAKKGLRYVTEDVPAGLVPVSELGRKLGVETPAIDTIINLADILFEADFRASGRNLEQLGLHDLSLDEIVAL